MNIFNLIFLYKINYIRNNVESSDNYKYQAAGITGIKKGKLLCETRNENRTTMSSKTGDNSNNNTERPRNMNKSRPRGAGPRDNKNTNFTITRKQHLLMIIQNLDMVMIVNHIFKLKDY